MHVHCTCMYVAMCSIECMCVCVLGGGGGWGTGVLWGLGHRDIQRIVLSLKFMILAFFL